MIGPDSLNFKAAQFSLTHFINFSKFSHKLTKLQEISITLESHNSFKYYDLELINLINFVSPPNL